MIRKTPDAKGGKSVIEQFLALATLYSRELGIPSWKLVQHIRQAFNMARMNQAGLYGAFTNIHINSAFAAAQMSGAGISNMSREEYLKNCQSFSLNLASLMGRRGTDKISYSKTGNLFGGSSDLEVLFGSEAEELMSIRKGALIQSQRDTWSFLHKSIFEYYLAESILGFFIASKNRFSKLEEIYLFGTIFSELNFMRHQPVDPYSSKKQGPQQKVQVTGGVAAAVLDELLLFIIEGR